MEMDPQKENSAHPVTDGNDSAQKKGPNGLVTSSHGIKYSLHMTSQAKNALMLRLEEWRKAKREKLGVQIQKPTLQINKTVKPLTPKKDCSNQGRESETVFERLYRNAKSTKTFERKVGSMSPFIKSKPVKSTTWNITKVDDPKCTSKNSKSTSEIESSGTLCDEEVMLTNDQDENKENLQANCCVLNASTDYIPSDGNKNNITDGNNVEFGIEKPDENNSEIVHESKPIFQGTCDALNENESNVIDVVQQNKIIDKTELYDNCLEKFNSNESKNRNGNILDEDEHSKMNVAKSFMEKPTTSNIFVQPNKGQIKKPSQLKEIGKSKVIAKLPIRRSISMLYRKKGGIKRSRSEKNLHELDSCIHRSVHHVKPASYSYEDTLGKDNKTWMNSTNLYAKQIKKGATSSSLRNKLEEWLEENGHSLDSYRHLRCFGISKAPKKFPQLTKKIEKTQKDVIPIEEKHNENLTESQPSLNSQEPSKIDCENWLKELYRLIVELKYPSEQCEEWLTAIRIKFEACTELPIYWECLAAVNANVSPLKTKPTTAGTEVEAVASLFDKMVIEQQKPQGGKLEKGLDPKNIFHSTVIKFALQEKNVKESGSKIRQNDEPHTNTLIATPVRRSSRNQTPLKKKNVVDSLQSLTPDVQKYTFKTNESLLKRL